MKEGERQTKFFRKFFTDFKKRKSDIENRRGASSASNTGETVILFRKFILDYISLNVLS